MYGNYWKIEEITGYKPKTTFWADFSIAENFGTNAIKDTYKCAFKEWKNNVEYLTELVLVLNWKIWEWYQYDETIARLYDELWRTAHQWAIKHLKGDDLKYYLETID